MRNIYHYYRRDQKKLWRIWRFTLIARCSRVTKTSIALINMITLPKTIANQGVLTLPYRNLIFLGVILLGLLGAIAVFSPFVAYNIRPDFIPVSLFVMLCILTGLAFIYSVLIINSHTNKIKRRNMLIYAISIGLLARLVMVWSTPILEDDWIRYLWEGSISAQGISPYTYSPSDGYTDDILGNDLPRSADEKINQLREFSRENNHYAYEVSYPFLSTIYPVGAQAMFRLSYEIAPFSLRAWRSILVGSEILSAGLILILLKKMGRSSFWILAYWWNPLVIITGINGAHMDLLLVPVMLATFVAIIGRHAFVSGALLGIAVSLKIWPLLITPLFARYLAPGALSLTHLKTSLSTLIRFMIPLSVISLAGLLPLLSQALSGDSGLSAYSSSWHKNSLIFSILHGGLDYITDHSDLIARLLMAAILSIGTLIICRPTLTLSMLITRVTLVIAGLFFLAPAGYPWYVIWFAYLACLRPTIVTFLLSVTAFAYYLRFPLKIMGYQSWFDYGVVPIEFGLPLLALLISSFINRRNRDSLIYA